MTTLRLPLLLLALLLLLWHLLPGQVPDLGEWAGWVGAALPLVLAALAQTQVVLAGGQGLAAGSTALFVNALAVTQMGGSTGSLVFWLLAGPLVGGGLGAINGLLIGYLRLSSTAVTLATSFVVAGLSLLLLQAPAPAVPERFRAWLLGDLPLGDLWPGLPMPFLLLALVLLVAWRLDRSALGGAIRRAGAPAGATDGEHPRHPGPALFAAYAVAGLGYGASGVFLTAQLGTADPILGGPTLVEIYAAVALGGSIPFLRQGSTLAAAIAALAVAALLNLLMPLHWQDYVAPALDGLLLLAALALLGWGRHRPPPPAVSARVAPPRLAAARLWWLAGVAALLGTATLAAGSPLVFLGNDLLVPMLVLGLLAIAQGAVIMSGQLDLALPSITALAGVALVALTLGDDAATLWLAPLVILGGGCVGLIGGGLGQGLGLPRVLVTLALSGLLQAAAIYLVIASPTGFAAPGLVALVVEAPHGLSPAVMLLAPLLALLLLVLRARPVQARLAALGGQRRGRGVTAALLHGAAGCLAAAAGILLAGYGGQFKLGLVDVYSLPALLAVVLAGFAIGRTGGNPLGLLLTVPLVVVLDTLLIGFGWSYPLRGIAFGLCLLAAVALQPLLTSRRTSPAAPSAPAPGSPPPRYPG